MTQTTTDTGLDSDQLVVGTANGPGIWLADAQTTGPADADVDWPAGWTSLGYATTDGVTLANSTDTEDINAWQALGALRTLITGRTVTCAFQLMQWNATNLALYWDVDTPTIGADGTFSFSVRSDQAGRRHAIGVDVRDGDNVVRYVLPRVQLSAAGDMQFQRSAAALLDVTFTVLETDLVLVQVMGHIPSAGGMTGFGGDVPVTVSETVHPSNPGAPPPHSRTQRVTG
jgi:hypothetical protein